MFKFFAVCLCVLACYLTVSAYDPALLISASQVAFVIPKLNVGMTWLMLAALTLMYVFHRIIAGKH